MASRYQKELTQEIKDAYIVWARLLDLARDQTRDQKRIREWAQRYSVAKEEFRRTNYSSYDWEKEIDELLEIIDG